MIKTYVLDTNVLIQSPESLYCFENNEVVLPLVVLEELDLHKKDDGETGRNVRKAIRLLETLRLQGNIIEGVPNGYGGSIRIEKNCIDARLPEDMPEHKSDNRILKVCIGLADVSDHPVILVTKDILLRIKAQTIGIPAEDYQKDQVAETENQYTGRIDVFTDEEHFKKFKKQGVPVGVVYQTDENGNRLTPVLYENEFVILHSDVSVKKTFLGRISGGVVRKLDFQKETPYGVNPRNAGQLFFQEGLMQPASKAPLVIAKGAAGTSKTFYALAVGLEKILNHPSGEYRRILICRPNSQFDDEIGFLPGSEEEKISPLMRPIYDNLEQLLDSDEDERYKDEAALTDKIMEIFERGLIKIEAMNFIRGRSIVKTYMIIDEAQNLTPRQIKGIITRAGKDTKIILLGDPQQIDRPYLDEKTNGLSYASEKMKGSALAWQVTFNEEECERSALAREGAERL
ncbi:MAG: PhoH family protein [Bilifractor sp.]